MNNTPVIRGNTPEAIPEVPPWTTNEIAYSVEMEGHGLRIILRLVPGRPILWTTTEIARLRRLAPLGARSAAEILERSVWSVRKAAQRHRISLRPEGERGGVVLGQPRGMSFVKHPALRRVREEALSRTVSVEELERRTAADLCPRCGRRPIHVDAKGLPRNASGFCRSCHLRHLAAGHVEEAAAAEEARRELDRERQRKHRARTAREEEG